MKKLAFAAMIGAAVIATPASAGELSLKANAAMARVKTTDLNLSQAEDMETLEKRIARAKQRVCRRDDRGQIVLPSKERACIAKLDKELSTQLVVDAAKQKNNQG